MYPRDQILCCLLVREAQKASHVRHNWSYAINTIATLLLKYKSMDDLPKRVRLAICIATVGAENIENFQWVSEIMCDWEYMNGPYWIIQEELWRHSFLSTIRAAIEYETGSTSLPSILQSLLHTIKHTAVPPYMHHKLVKKKLFLLKAEFESLMDTLIHSACVEQDFNAYADKYPLPDYCSWFVKWGQEILLCTQGDDCFKYSTIYDDASLLAMLGTMIEEGTHTLSSVCANGRKKELASANIKSSNTTTPSNRTSTSNASAFTNADPSIAVEKEIFASAAQREFHCNPVNARFQDPLHSPLVTLNEASIKTPQAPIKAPRPSTHNRTTNEYLPPPISVAPVLVLQLPESERPPPQLTGSMSSIISTLEFMQEHPNLQTNLFGTDHSDTYAKDNEAKVIGDTDGDRAVNMDVSSCDRTITEMISPLSTGLELSSTNKQPPHTVNRYDTPVTNSIRIESENTTCKDTKSVTSAIPNPNIIPISKCSSNSDPGFMEAIGNHVWECFDADVTYPF